MNQTEMSQLLREIDECASRASWKGTGPIDPESDPTAKSFSAEVDGWVLMVISYDIEPQGFPKGSRGYDGTAVRAGLVMRLTRELAEKIYKAAEEQT